MRQGKIVLATKGRVWGGGSIIEIGEPVPKWKIFLLAIPLGVFLVALGWLVLNSAKTAGKLEALRELRENVRDYEWIDADARAWLVEKLNEGPPAGEVYEEWLEAIVSEMPVDGSEFSEPLFRKGSFPK